MIITHENNVALHTKRTIVLRDGKIIDDHRQAPVEGLPPRYQSAGAGPQQVQCGR